MPQKVFTIKNACPLCGGDVVGNDELKYYCKRCNLLFNFSELKIQEKNYQLEERGLERKKDYDLKISKSSSNLSDNRPEMSVNNSCETSRGKVVFVASKKSNKFHVANCPFAQNILDENKIIFKSKEEAISNGFSPCRCVK